MRKVVLLGMVLALAILSIGTALAYMYLTSPHSFRGVREEITTRGMRGEFRIVIQRRAWVLRIEVSDEFKQKVVEIAKGDQDVQSLLKDGYEIAYVDPIIKAVVQAGGEVTIKATGAFVVLRKEGVGLAFVEVDLEAGKVVRITIVSRRVIEKPP